MSARLLRVIAAMLVLCSSVEALESGLPSKTAVYAATARALVSKNPDPKQRNPDYLAMKFLGPRERAILPDLPLDALDLDYESAMVTMS